MIKSFKVGDVLSESSHYKVLADNGNLNFKLKHLESGDMVYIGKEYIHNYLESADDFTNEVKVTREDKKDGTLGIRSIFEGIHGSQVFTVCFKKQTNFMCSLSGSFSWRKIAGTIFEPSTSWPWKVQPTRGS